MRAREFERGWNGATPYDDLKDYIESDEGDAILEKLDGHWQEVLELAEQYGFIVQSFGGTATLATHTEYIEQLGHDKEAQRLRMCNVEMGGDAE